MLKSWFKFLGRNRLYTAVEELGLTVSLAFVILIGSYVWQQFGVVRENPDHDRIYAVHSKGYMAHSYWDREILETLPEVELAARISRAEKQVAEIDGTAQLVSCLSADPEFFRLFPYYRIAEGSAECLASGSGALVSRSFAAKIDDGSGVLGKTFRYGDREYVIGGVAEDFRNTLVRYSDIIVPAASPVFDRLPRFMVTGTHLTLFRTVPDCDADALRADVTGLFAEEYKQLGREAGLVLSSLKAIYFCENGSFLNSGNLSVLRLLMSVVLLLLFSAVLNYINLNLALTGRRAREMATRRLLGAGRGAVVLRYIVESLLFTAFCFALALLLARLLTPLMNRLLATEVALQFLLTPGYVLFYLGSVLLTGAVAGLLPALAVSRFSPLDVVRGTFTYRSKLVFSRIFIALQNVFAVVLLVWACVMELQMKHMVERPLHADVSDLFALQTGLSQGEALQPFEDRLRAMPFVRDIGLSSGYPGRSSTKTTVRLESGESTMLSYILCDSAAFRMIALEQVRNFGHPLIGSLWLSESAFAMADSDTSSRFAASLPIGGRGAESLGGIVRDFPLESAATADGRSTRYTGAVVVRPDDARLSLGGGMLIRTSGPHDEARRQILAAWEEFDTARIGVYREPGYGDYVEDLNAGTLEAALRSVRLVELFMALALLISLLGLVAMSTHFSRQGTKEIAVRKVFGSDTQQETFRMVRNYMLTVLIALGFGIPIAIFAAERWLEQFSYRIGHYGWVFPIVTLAVLLIDFGAILWQTLRAAQTDPAAELKKE